MRCRTVLLLALAAICTLQCVICVNARATVQTSPCGHRVVCRRCFVKTIQMAVSQRLLPLRCVICRAKILRLKHTLIPRDCSMAGKSWLLPQSASEYSMQGAVAGSGGGRWTSANVPASASLYSMASGSSSISGVSSVSSATSSSTRSSASSTSLGKSRQRQPAYSSFKKNQVHSAHSVKMRIQECQGVVQAAPEEKEGAGANRERRLPPIVEFQRDFRAGRASTRIRCAQKIVTQLECSASPHQAVQPSSSTARSSQRQPTTITAGSCYSKPSSSSSSSSSSASTSATWTNRNDKRAAIATTTTTPSGATPKKLTVAQQVQLTKKEKDKEKERVKAEKAKLKEAEKIRQREAERAEKAEKARQKEAKKLAKEEKKRAKKEAKARRKEAEQSLLAADSK